MKEMGEKVAPVLIDVKCDICCKSCKTDCSYEYATLLASWGFDSKRDLEYHECHICEPCYEKVLVFLQRLSKNLGGAGVRVSQSEL